MEKRKEIINYLKVINFDYPEWIPATVDLMPATWFKYEKELEKIILSHPSLFPNYKIGDYKKIKKNLPIQYKKGIKKDVWGIVWENIEEGLDAAPIEEFAPLKNWDDLENFKVPDPLKYDRFGELINWEERKRNIEKIKKEGGLAGGGLFHGSMYMQLYYLRGFTNFMVDIATKDPHLNKLIEIVLNYNLEIIKKWIEIGVEIIYFGDDLGFQKSLPISPPDWRQYIKPPFSKMFSICRKNNVYVYLHTDGNIVEIIPDLIECGVNVLNPQIRANTLEGIEKTCKKKIAINLDLDRQLFPFATEKEIENHIKKVVDTLALPEGGLMLHAECEPDVPLKNIDKICNVFEELGCKSL